MRLLFLCTHNSARSILAEALTNRWGDGRLLAFSAGSHPSGHVHPFAIAVLRELDCPVDALRSKSWDLFTAPSRAESVDAVITVCDDAAGEICPVWPGLPVRAHWGSPDPSCNPGDSTRQMDAFRCTAERLDRRLRALRALPLERLDPPALQRELQRVHEGALHEEDTA